MRGKVHRHAANTGKSHSSPKGPPAPDLKVTFDPPNGVFMISADVQMPVISVMCAPENLAPGPPGAKKEEPTECEWTASLVMSPAGIPYAKGRTIAHPPIRIVSKEAKVAIPFAAVRGGTLSVSVKAKVGNAVLKGTATVEIRGTNPSTGQVRMQGASELQMKLFYLESGLKQFLNGRGKPGYPIFSHDGLGGVGLGQLTPKHSRPTDEQCWNWKENLKAALALWDTNRVEAANLLKKYQHGSTFTGLVQTYNAARVAPPVVAKGAAPAKAPAVPLKPLTITLPDPTDEMLDNMTLRLYNGMPAVGEYRAELDAKGLLVVDVNHDGARGTAHWHEVTGSERRDVYVARGMKAETGDPDYVQDVRNVVLP